jgi:hypothetical protein
VSEALPVAAASAAGSEPVTLATGMFRTDAHETRGTAAVHRLADGKRVLRLMEFETSNGPALHVYLVAAPEVKDSGTVKKAGFIDLGPLKGNKGDQNYDLPAEADLEKYRSVSIWCARFNVNFGAAPLMDAESAANAPVALAEGKFSSAAHETAGTAAVYRLPDGQRVLRLTDFQTSNGPDVRVYLVAAPEVKDNDTVKKAGFIELGKLKGNQGDQNYPVPASVDLEKYRSVSIWCARFGVNFGAASLQRG